MLSRIALSVALLVAFTTVGTQAWWCTGHMTVAMIAKQHMDTETYDTVNTWIQTLSNWGPFDKSPNMVEVACWADDIKSNIFSMAGWHFKNIPYDPSGYDFTQNVQHETVDVVIPQMAKAIYKYPNTWEMTFALANLIHFYGDIHQPLHVTTMFSAQFPNSDFGGNEFMINLNGKVFDLHGTWDSLCGKYMNAPKRPLSTTDLAEIETLATNFVANHTGITDAEAKNYNTTDMAQEGYEYAVKYAYADLVPNSDTPLTQAYLDKCWWAATRRVALAGRRLANELNYLFKENKHRVSAKMIHERIRQGRQEVADASYQKHKTLFEASKKRREEAAKKQEKSA